MSIHGAQRLEGWRALVERDSEREREALRAALRGAPGPVVASGHAPPHVGDDRLALARWEDEGGRLQRHPAPLPVNEAVRDLVRTCLLQRVPLDGGAAAPGDAARRGPHA